MLQLGALILVDRARVAEADRSRDALLDPALGGPTRDDAAQVNGRPATLRPGALAKLTLRQGCNLREVPPGAQEAPELLQEAGF